MGIDGCGSAGAARTAGRVGVDGTRRLVAWKAGMDTPALSQKPTRTVRLGEAKIEAILDRLDGADHAGIKRRYLSPVTETFHPGPGLTPDVIAE